MKKIMVLLLMMVMASLASPLFASPPIFEKTLNLNTGQENVKLRQNRKSIVAGHAVKKIIISHKDTLLHSCDEVNGNRMKVMKKIGCSVCGTAVTANVAVVCSERDS